MSDKPSPKVVRAYSNAKSLTKFEGPPTGWEILADELQKSEAARLEAEFKNEHWITMMPGGKRCSDCGYPESNFSEQHNWTKTDWLALADLRLRGEE